MTAYAERMGLGPGQSVVERDPGGDAEHEEDGGDRAERIPRAGPADEVPEPPQQARTARARGGDTGSDAAFGHGALSSIGKRRGLRAVRTGAYCARSHCTRFLIWPMSFGGEVLTILCASSWPSGNFAFSPDVRCWSSRASALGLPLYFCATFFHAGPSLSLETVWQLKQLFWRARASAASASAACAVVAIVRRIEAAAAAAVAERR